MTPIPIFFVFLRALCILFIFIYLHVCWRLANDINTTKTRSNGGIMGCHVYSQSIVIVVVIIVILSAEASCVVRYRTNCITDSPMKTDCRSSQNTTSFRSPRWLSHTGFDRTRSLVKFNGCRDFFFLNLDTLWSRGKKSADSRRLVWIIEECHAEDWRWKFKNLER